MKPRVPEQKDAGERPSLEYQYAFDLCAEEVHRSGGPAVLHASSAFCARELLKRIEALQPAQVVTGGTSEELSELLSRLGPEVQVAQAWSVAIPRLRPGVDIWAETAGVGGLGTPGNLAAAAVWAEPERGTREGAIQSFARYLEPGGRLCVVTSGPLRRGLPEWKRDEAERPARHPAGLKRTAQRLRQGGFTVGAMYGFHGPGSLAWGVASRVPAAAGREYVVDRFQAVVRTLYVVHGWQADWAPVAVVLARRGREKEV